MNKVSAQPFVKWAGGKRQSLLRLLARIPGDINERGTYFEPFVGGGAVFWALRPRHAVLSDSNERLMRTYRAIRDNVERVIMILDVYQRNHSRLGKKLYMAQRAIDVDKLFASPRLDAELAAWFIYLNRTCFNGIYRVNQAGKFNVPMGRYTNPLICDADNLRACSDALQGVELLTDDFRDIEGHPRCNRDAFIYFDPPYAPLSATSDFTSYTAEKFGRADHEALRDMILRLKAKGVPLLLSNSAAPLVRELYPTEHFTVEEIGAKRAINSKVARRGIIKELLIS